jgi:hypothetical protein
MTVVLSTGICGARHLSAAAFGLEFDTPYVTPVLLRVFGGNAGNSVGAAFCMRYSRCGGPERSLQPWSSKICCSGTHLCSVEHHFVCESCKFFPMSRVMI